MSVPTEAEQAARIATADQAVAIAKERVAAAKQRLRSVHFEYDPAQAPKGSHAEYAARLLERTVAHINVDVAGLVQRYLLDVSKDLPADVAARLYLRTGRLVEDVISAARSNTHRRLGLDLATTLLPRLERNPVQ